jgi:hypothetical protein
MNKSLRLTLFLVLASFACFSSGQGDTLFHPVFSSKLNIATLQQHKNTLCGKNDTNNKSKNAIRIKAWDDMAVMVLPANWASWPDPFYVVKPFCCYYNGPTRAPKRSRDQLRGPPTA